MLNGVINIYKEAGYTSRDAVSRLSGILRQRKIGHTGTLDPAAEGVLPMCIGSATKLCDLLTGSKKEYQAVVKLGFLTDTEDITGVVVEKTDFNDEWYHKNITLSKVNEVLQSFVGELEQIPPMYSAKKVNGKRLYELAREGRVIERKPSLITIYRIDLDELDTANKEITITVECSKGTYIRTLCKDIGEKLLTKASMKHLLRTRSGNFYVEKSYRLDEIEDFIKNHTVEKYITTVEEIFSELDSLYLEGYQSKLLDNGAPLEFSNLSSFIGSEITFLDGKLLRMYNERKEFRAVYQYNESKNVLKVYKMF